MIENYFNYLGYLLDGLEFLILVTSVITFFFLMLNQYSAALKAVLGPCGMSFWPRIRVLFICRKSPTKKRAFIEFAILNTQGLATLPSEWHSIINEFKSYYQEGQNEQCYTIPNCTSLINDEFSEAVGRYFDFFRTPKVRKVFGLGKEDIGWVTKICIEDAYVTPTALLTGLLSKYEENWDEFIKRYVSTAYITESKGMSYNDILPNELYFTFAWLLWGPSYELSYEKRWSGICQISFGDESNSLPVVVNRGTGAHERLLRRLQENQDRRYGALVTAYVSLYENKAYYEAHRGDIDPTNDYFVNKIQDGTLSYAVQMDDLVPCQNYKAQKYYCTAYVWVLFELEDARTFAFQPEKSVAFFEHANLTDTSTYDFLVETLLDKCVKHFESIFSRPELAGRKYRFVCAMNDQIAEALRSRIVARAAAGDPMAAEFQARLILTPKRTPSDAFAAFDDYFSPSTNLQFEEVQLHNKNSVADLGDFYTRIYMECFPDTNERETFDSLLAYLKNAESASQYRYHIILAKDQNGHVVGGAIFDYFVASNAGVIEFVAVRTDAQSSGIGTQVYNRVLQILKQDAYDKVKKPLSHVFCEIDSPDYSRASIKKYLYFWTKHNFRRLSFDYIQPSLSSGQTAVDGLWFTVSCMRGQDSVGGSYVLRVIYDYMKYAMNIEDPASHEDYKKMESQLQSMQEVPQEPVI